MNEIKTPNPMVSMSMASSSNPLNNSKSVVCDHKLLRHCVGLQNDINFHDNLYFIIVSYQMVTVM